MPTTTARLALPVPLESDPANVPPDMLKLANALDVGANPNYSGVAVIVATPGSVGALPASPIVGTIYPVNGAPPYLLYYTGESTPGTATAPTGWRLVGQAGTNTANISNTSPGNSATPGIQPVWAPLDHQHASLPWSASQTAQLYTGYASSDGVANAYARADHQHAPELPWGLPSVVGSLLNPFSVPSSLTTFLATSSLGVGLWLFTFNSAIAAPTAQVIATVVAGSASVSVLSGVTTVLSTGAGPLSASMSFFVRVTSAGTMLFQAESTSAGNSILGVTSGSGVVTGYTGIQVGQ